VSPDGGARAFAQALHLALDVYVNCCSKLASNSGAAVATKTSSSLVDYRHDAALKGSGRRFELKRFDPADKPFSSGNKARDKAEVEALAARLDKLQDLFYADRRFKLLVVLQGTDTAGKDGTIRGVFGQMSALGVRTIGWKAPTEPERSHDYLWRIHQQVPANGEVMIFNRSHYEDVLVPPVSGWITPEQTKQRYAQINDFERMLSENGTVICKFLLHISKDEQRIRLQQRLDDPAKNWKFALGDLDARKLWDAYQKAYSAAIAATGTTWAPWTIVPADSKTHRNLMIATAMKQLLTGLKLRYPPSDPALKNITVV
jgi:PPK2 family polyphosphate:nucleotide phosphotransferase